MYCWRTKPSNTLKEAGSSIDGLELSASLTFAKFSDTCSEKNRLEMFFWVTKITIWSRKQFSISQTNSIFGVTSCWKQSACMVLQAACMVTICLYGLTSCSSDRHLAGGPAGGFSSSWLEGRFVKCPGLERVGVTLRVILGRSSTAARALLMSKRDELIADFWRRLKCCGGRLELVVWLYGLYFSVHFEYELDCGDEYGDVYGNEYGDESGDNDVGDMGTPGDCKEALDLRRCGVWLVNPNTWFLLYQPWWTSTIIISIVFLHKRMQILIVD